jgi:hypothetical protein
MSQKGYDVVISMVCPYRAIREDLKANNEVVEILFDRTHFAGKDKLHVQAFERPNENYLIFVNGDDPERSFGELLSRLGL